MALSSRYAGPSRRVRGVVINNHVQRWTSTSLPWIIAARIDRSQSPPACDGPIAGPIIASLDVSTTGTDADWIVKLIDVYPSDSPGDLSNAQIMLAGEVFRSKFRNSFSEPEPLVPREVTHIEYDLLDKAHTFSRGHRIMVQLQSTWFPVIDRNPQAIVNIYEAAESDFQVATHRVYRSSELPSHIELRVIQ